MHIQLSRAGSLLKLVAAAALFAAVVPAKADTPAVSLTLDPVNTFNNGFGFSLGFDFHTNSAITVTSLGYFSNNAAFTEDHEVGIFDAGGTLLASTTVNNMGTDVANFRYESIAPLNLWPTPITRLWAFPASPTHIRSFRRASAPIRASHS